MRRAIEYFVELLCWIAFVYSMLLVIVASDSLYAIFQSNPSDTRQKFSVVLQDLIPSGWTWFGQWASSSMVSILFVMGAMSLLIGLFFLGRIIVLRRERKRIVHQSSRGQIQISLSAIRSFIERLLIHEFSLKKFHILIYQTRTGLDVLIRATVPIGRNVVQTGERIQKVLQERVEERLGVKINHIEIIAQGVAGEDKVDAEDEEGTKMYASGGELD